NGKATDAKATYTAGGAPEDVTNGFTLTILEGGSFSTPIVAGTNLALFSGGNVQDAVEAAPNATAFFISVSGKFVGYVVGAPTFVNAGFFAAFPDGDIPANTFMVVLAK